MYVAEDSRRLYYSVERAEEMGVFVADYLTQTGYSKHSIRFYADEARTTLIAENDTASSLGLANGSHIYALLTQQPSIGEWGAHAGSVGIQFLRASSCASGSEGGSESNIDTAVSNACY
jgi:hypothetical protein